MRARRFLSGCVAALVANCCLLGAAAAQSPRRGGDSAESGTYRLYKFEQAIGEETYRLRHEAGALVLTDTFLFTDRGTRVPLDTHFRAAGDLTPRSFDSKGKSSRFSDVDLALEVQRGTVTIRQRQQTHEMHPSTQFFVINGYSPIAQQMLMLRYWIGHDTPAALSILPQGTTVQIVARGVEQLVVNGRRVTLTRYTVSGVIWGREVLWLDGDQRLVAAVTTDAEFDHFEATAEGYAPLLSTFVAEAGQDGMAMLAELAKGFRATRNGPLAIVGATVIDGTGAPAMSDSTIVVDGGRITAVGRRDVVSIPPEATVFDAQGKFLLPGLWDMHAHVEQVEWGPLYLAAGVTTARDVGNERDFIVAVRDALRDGHGLGPQLLLAGMVDGSGPTALGIARVDSPIDAVQWVREYKQAGFQQMKIYSSVRLEQVRAVCEAAHRVGMTVTGHIPTGMTIYQGVDAGMDQVNHIQYVLAALAPRPRAGATREERLTTMASVNVTGPEAQQAFEFLKQHETVIDPTLALMELDFHPAAESFARVEPGVDKVAPELTQPLTSGGMPAASATLGRRVFQNELALVGALHQAGVRIVAGTDQAVPGHSLHRELELYVQAGFTPLEAIQAATVVPARVMGVAEDVGTVEVSKRADLILLDANPLDDIHNIRSIRYVITNGVLYPTAPLWESVGFKP